MSEQKMTLREIVQELRSMAESLEIDVPSDAGYVEALQSIIETLEHLQETKLIEIIINCVNCEYVRHQAKGYTVFSVACNDYHNLPCPHCHQSNWNVTARIAKQEGAGDE